MINSDKLRISKYERSNLFEKSNIIIEENILKIENIQNFEINPQLINNSKIKRKYTISDSSYASKSNGISYYKLQTLCYY